MSVTSPYTTAKMKKAGIAVIYVLKHPRTKKIFYVGSTRKSLSGALRRHTHHRRPTCRPGKGEVIRKLQQKNLTPLIEVIFTCPVEEQFKQEKKWIRKLRCKHKLTNIVCM